MPISKNLFSLNCVQIPQQMPCPWSHNATALSGGHRRCTLASNSLTNWRWPWVRGLTLVSSFDTEDAVCCGTFHRREKALVNALDFNRLRHRWATEEQPPLLWDGSVTMKRWRQTKLKYQEAAVWTRMVQGSRWASTSSLEKVPTHLRLDGAGCHVFMLQLWGCHGGRNLALVRITSQTRQSVNLSQWNTTQVLLWDLTDTFGTNMPRKCGVFHGLRDTHLSRSWSLLC